MNGVPESRPVEESPAASPAAHASPARHRRHASRHTQRAWLGLHQQSVLRPQCSPVLLGTLELVLHPGLLGDENRDPDGRAGRYTILLAATTFLVVRWGKVWEDGRSLLLLLVVMFLGLSVGFDDSLTGHFPVGAICSLTGLAYSTVLSEIVLRGLKLRLGDLAADTLLPGAGPVLPVPGAAGLHGPAGRCRPLGRARLSHGGEHGLLTCCRRSAGDRSTSATMGAPGHGLGSLGSASR